MNMPPHPTWIEINVSAIEQNTRAVLAFSKCRVIAVVKANAYGHGAVEVSKIALSAGASALAVTYCDEAFELRRAGIHQDILVLGGVLPEEVDRAIGEGLTLTIFDRQTADILAARARALGKTARAHLKVETGLGRFGVFPEEALDLSRTIIQLGGIHLDGVFSHYAMADVLDHPLTDLQLRRFEQTIGTLHQSGIRPDTIHLANSAAVFIGNRPLFNTVRVGEAIIGLGTGCDELPFPSQLRRAFCWKARLMACKQYPAGWGISYGQAYHTGDGEWIGIVPVGHGEGYRRAPGNQVLIGGKRIPVVGNVAISQCMVSLPGPVALSTEVVLIGSQGSCSIHPEELSQRWKVPLTNVTNVDRHICRVYIHDEDLSQ